MNQFSNKYHAYLQDVPNVGSPSVVVPDTNTIHQGKLYKDQINPELIEWVYDRGLALREDGSHVGEYFYIPPNALVPMHSDKHEINDYTKLNWIGGGQDSVMRWYELKPGKQITARMHTPNGSAYAIADYGDVDLMCEYRIGSPSLVNIGRLHDFLNGPEPCFVYCAYIYHPDTGQRLSWDDAVLFLNDRIKK